MSINKLAKNLVSHVRTKHIEIHYHFIGERVLAGDINLVHVHKRQQITDVFTLGEEKHEQLRKRTRSTTTSNRGGRASGNKVASKLVVCQ